MNEITEMFANSVLTKNTHPGYKIFIAFENGTEKDVGPYSKPFALSFAKDIFFNHGGIDVFVVDMETGEIIKSYIEE